MKKERAKRGAPPSLEAFGANEAQPAGADELIDFPCGMEALAACRTTDRIVHMLCIRGSLSFLQLGVHYNLGPGDYAIIPNAAIAGDFAASADLEAILMTLSADVGSRLALRSSYGIVGHMSLLRNPVMKLTPEASERCRVDLLRLKARQHEKDHLFREEMLGHLLAAHILDLYDWHARASSAKDVPDRAAALLRRFINDLAAGAYRTHRDLGWYAARLCVSPHYLSELCRRTSGRGAGYFIDFFTVQEIARRLCDKRERIQSIADSLAFSSESYFTRYVKKHLGTTPGAFRRARTGL